MSYNEYENSRDRGSPIEAYKFTGPYRTYRYTSHDQPIILLSETYEPVPTGRKGITLSGGNQDRQVLEVSIAAQAQLVKDYAYQQVPPFNLKFQLFRSHRQADLTADVILLWSGVVSRINVIDEFAKFYVPGIFSRAVQSECPNVFYQNPCNHVLYDSMCGLNRASHSAIREVTNVTPLAVQVSSQPFADHSLVAGEIVAQSSGERRGIVGNTGTEILIVYPFGGLSVGQDVEFFKGCDHSFATCRDYFSNQLNYGGFPSIPTDNPFEGEI